jgi:hypothetical protein
MCIVRPALRHGLGLLMAAIAACKPTAPEWVNESDFPLQLGQGDYAPFVEHENGAPLALHHGFQGGQHIGYSLRGTELPVDALLTVTLWAVNRADANLLVEPAVTTVVMARPDAYLYVDTPMPPDGTVETIANIFFIEDADAVLGLELELRVQAQTEDGRVARAFAFGVVAWGSDEDLEGEPSETDNGGNEAEPG